MEEVASTTLKIEEAEEGGEGGRATVLPRWACAVALAQGHLERDGKGGVMSQEAVYKYIMCTSPKFVFFFFLFFLNR